MTKTLKPSSEEDEILKRYLAEIGKIPLLSRMDEKALAIKKKGGDKSALRKLVESNLRYVVNVAKKYLGLGLSLQDLICEGNLGLIRAAELFDHEMNVRFTTYAHWWIKQTILKALSTGRGPLTLPIRQATLFYQMQKTEGEMIPELERKPSREEVAKEMDMDVGDLENIIIASTEAVPLDSFIDEENDFIYGDTIPERETKSADQGLIEQSIHTIFHSILMELPPKERAILTMRFGLDGSKSLTLKETADRINLSRERVRQLQKKAMNSLRASKQAKALLAYLN